MEGGGEIRERVQKKMKKKYRMRHAIKYKHQQKSNETKVSIVFSFPFALFYSFLLMKIKCHCIHDSKFPNESSPSEPQMVRSSHWINSFVNLLVFRDFHKRGSRKGEGWGESMLLYFLRPLISLISLY